MASISIKIASQCLASLRKANKIQIYADAPQKIKLNNEVGMDWVQRNCAAWQGTEKNRKS